jgi:hypothetical protein
MTVRAGLLVSTEFDGTFDGVTAIPARSIPSMPLTELEIKNAKPKEKPNKLTDGGWLFLLVNPNGSKLWRLGFPASTRSVASAVGPSPNFATGP